MSGNIPTPFLTKKRTRHILITMVKKKNFDTWLKKQNREIKELVAHSDFHPTRNRTILVHGDHGKLLQVITGVNNAVELFDLSVTAGFLSNALSTEFLETTSFQIDGEGFTTEELVKAHVGWGMESYKFDTYKSKSRTSPSLQWSKGVDKLRANTFIESMYLVRNLINPPANHMGPAELEKESKILAKQHKAKVKVIKDKALIKENLPMIFAVGDSSPRRPRLIDMHWGDEKHPKLTLIGKGVCFDTGGLDIKPSQYMKHMKKDMGGAAHVLGLAHLIMALNIPVRLRVLIPAVENSISGKAFRPGDIFTSRKGLTIENTNTDAEGRLILSDSLTLASEEETDLIIDFATLTGSARAALGPDVPPFFSNCDKTSNDLQSISEKVHDQVWRMPLWQPYKRNIENKIADLVNSSGVPGDLIYSALFLESFLIDNPNWIHMDVFAWEQFGRPGRTQGAADTGMRAVFAMLEKRYGG